MKNWFVRASYCSKRLTSATNRTFSVQHACGLSTTPTLSMHADATAHAQALYWKGSSGHETALLQSVAVLRYSGYRARGVCALQSSSYGLGFAQFKIAPHLTYWALPFNRHTPPIEE